MPSVTEAVKKVKDEIGRQSSELSGEDYAEFLDEIGSEIDCREMALDEESEDEESEDEEDEE